MPIVDGQVAIAELVGVEFGLAACVAFCAGVEDAFGSWLLLLNGAQADKSSTMATIGSIRRGMCICNSYLSR